MVGQNKSATFTSPNWTKYHRSPWKHLALLTSQVDIWNRWHLVASFLGNLQACQLKILNIIQVPSINFIRNIWLFHLPFKGFHFCEEFSQKKTKPSEFPKGFPVTFCHRSKGGSKIPGRCRHHPVPTLLSPWKVPDQSNGICSISFWFSFCMEKNPSEKKVEMCGFRIWGLVAGEQIFVTFGVFLLWKVDVWNDWLGNELSKWGRWRLGGCHVLTAAKLRSIKIIHRVSWMKKLENHMAIWGISSHSWHLTRSTV